MEAPSTNIIDPRYITRHKNIENKMIQYLDDRSLFNLCKTNKAIYELCKNDDLWMERLQNRFPFFFSIKPEGVSYRNYYLKIVGQIHNLLKALGIGIILSEERALENIVRNVGINGLELCSKLGYLEMVRYMIEKIGMNPHIKDELALRTASTYGHLPVVKYLAEKTKANVHIYDEYPLDMASARGHLPVVRYLIEEAKANPYVSNSSPLRMAASAGQLEVVKYLTQKENFNYYILEDALSRARGGKHFSVVNYLESL